MTMTQLGQVRLHFYHNTSPANDASTQVSDDGRRTMLTDKVYGALVVAMFKGLESQKNSIQPSFRASKVTSEWADQMKGLNCSAQYGPYCKILGMKLFAGKSTEDWLGADEQASIKEDMEEDEDDDEEEPEAWYAKPGVADEGDLVLSRAWKEYKAYLDTVPRKPMKGPGSWDISKWTSAQKKPFSFDEGGDSDDY
ncbi:hypothetical protein H0H87_001671 [Tephrocybe sp. NHM501043]|nr:hypothetical protein H0H87_001671 [Tephrocybe sp. NHM501043]